jgi:hypothetical protein
VVACIERVQAQLLSTHPQLQPCLLEPVTAHKTLLVLHLQDEVGLWGGGGCGCRLERAHAPQHRRSGERAPPCAAWPQVHQAALGAVLASLAGALRAQGLGQQAVALAGLSAFRNQVLCDRGVCCAVRTRRHCTAACDEARGMACGTRHCVDAARVAAQVLYLDVSPGRARDQLQRLGDAIVSHFQAAGGDLVLPEPGRGFTPHVTVAKTSRLQGRRHHHPGKGRGGRGACCVCKLPACATARLAAHKPRKLQHQPSTPRHHMQAAPRFRPRRGRRWRARTRAACCCRS